MMWWIVLAVVVVLLALVLVSRRRKGGTKGHVDQRDVDRVRRDSQSRGFGAM